MWYASFHLMYWRTSQQDGLLRVEASVANVAAMLKAARFSPPPTFVTGIVPVGV